MKNLTLKILLTLSLLLTAGIVADTARAQSRKELRAHIPFAFNVNNKVFPAGEYSLEQVATGASKDLLVITNLKEARAKVYVLVMSERLSKSLEESTLVFKVYDGTRYFLSQVVDIDEGREISLPKSRTEQLLARRSAAEQQQQQPSATLIAAIRLGR